MKTLSTGEPSTLKTYATLSRSVFGLGSPQHKYILKMIEDSPNGENEEVWADESQMLFLLVNLKDQNAGK